MAFINLADNTIQCKIVYYGPGRGGKTTNLLYIHKAMAEAIRGKMVTIDTKGDRTLFFDFLPLELGVIKDWKIKIQLFTVPGQVMYNATRKLVLKGVDGIVFVADCIMVQKDRNIESIENLKENLITEKHNVDKIPLVLQYNKSDLHGSNIPTYSKDEMNDFLNPDNELPFYLASALTGPGVFDTLRDVSKRTVKEVSRKLLNQK